MNDRDKNDIRKRLEELRRNNNRNNNNNNNNSPFFNSQWIFALIIIIAFTTTAFILNSSKQNNDEEKRIYIETVQGIVNDLNSKSDNLTKIDPSDTDALIAAYEEILQTVKKAKGLIAPKELADFDFKFQVYMYGLKTSYTQIIEGTRDNDFSIVAKGLKELNSIDNSFLLNLQ